MGEVISILSAGTKKNDKKDKKDEKELAQEHDSSYFEQVEAANKAKQDRMRREREKANRSTLRSYRIKT